MLHNCCSSLLVFLSFQRKSIFQTEPNFPKQLATSPVWLKQVTGAGSGSLIHWIKIIHWIIHWIKIWRLPTKPGSYNGRCGCLMRINYERGVGHQSNNQIMKGWFELPVNQVFDFWQRVICKRSFSHHCLTDLLQLDVTTAVIIKIDKPMHEVVTSDDASIIRLRWWWSWRRWCQCQWQWVTIRWGGKVL